jgi:SAM-dependent methyltransferase
MRRETVNRMRFILEDVLPPIIHDSWLFRGVARLAWGHQIDALADFRARAPFLSRKEYEKFYRALPRLNQDTDNSQACIDKIIADIAGNSVCDVGCGTGYLLTRIRDAHRAIARLTGLELFVDEGCSIPGIEFRTGSIEQLPFPDAHFDTVVCTHVLEHILDCRRAIAELRRVAATRLIIVVPREREYRYTFNPHFHFFPYTHSFLKVMHPVPTNYICLDIGRDIYYCETSASHERSSSHGPGP